MLTCGSVVILRPRNVLERPAKVRVEAYDTLRRAYSGIQLGMGYVTFLPPLHSLRSDRISAVWTMAGWQCVLPGVI
jgi:hypothetical protein